MWLTWSKLVLWQNMSVGADEWGGTPGDNWHDNYLVTSGDNTGTWVALHPSNIFRPRHQQEGVYYLPLQCRRIIELWPPQLIPETYWTENCFHHNTHSWGHKNKHRKDIEIPSEDLNPNNLVLIYSTIKCLCINDRQDVSIRMLCGYWIVWEQYPVALPASIAVSFVSCIYWDWDWD